MRILASNGPQHTPQEDRSQAPPAHLLEEHRREIEDSSSVSPEIRAGRGYYSVTRRAQLEGTPLKNYQRRAPAWVAPMYSPDGRTRSLQIKPKHPRRDKRGKPVKYDTPAETSNILTFTRSTSSASGTPAFASG